MAGAAIASNSAAGSPLPAAAQEAVNQGMSADQQGNHQAEIGDFRGAQRNYLAAIDHFREALRAAPDDPQIFFDLGVAESKIPGRELRAISWFGAYLSVQRDAPDTTGVTNQINKLQGKSRQTLLTLIRSADDAATRDDDSLSMSSVVERWARAGDFSAALQGAAKITSARSKNDAYGSVAIYKAKAGDFEGAKAAWELIGDETEKSRTQTKIIQGQVAAADFEGALRTWAAMTPLGHVASAPTGGPTAASVIAAVQRKLGDRAGARETLVAAIREALLVEAGSGRDLVYYDIAEAQALGGDISVAQHSAALIGNDPIRVEAVGNILSAMVTSGRVSQALAIANTYSDAPAGRPKDDYNWHFQSELRLSIAVAQAKRGDLAGAHRTAALIRFSERRAWAEKYIASSRTSPNALEATAAAWQHCLDDSASDDPCALNRATFLDLPGKLEGFPPSDEVSDLVNKLLSTVDEISAAQEVIRDRLALQNKALESGQ